MIEKLFNKTTIELIDLIAKEPTHIRDIAERLNTSPGYIVSIIKFLKKNDFLKEKKVKNRKIISLNDKNLYVSKVRSLINLENISRNNYFKKLIKLGTAGIYGSYANGTDDKLSDIDLWVYTNRKSLEIQGMITNLEKDIKRKINFIVLNKDKIKNLKNRDYEFYIRLKLTSMVFGEDIFD